MEFEERISTLESLFVSSKLTSHAQAVQSFPTLEQLVANRIDKL